MRLITRLLLILLIVAFASCGPKDEAVQQAPNYDEQLSSQLGNAVLWYQSSAEMRQSYYQAYQYAKMIMKDKLTTINTDKKPAVVLDIDETVLDNSPSEAELIINLKEYNDPDWEKWIDMAQAAALPGAIDFVEYAKEMGVEVFYISNREQAMLGPTLKNMQQLNFVNADSSHIILKTDKSDKTGRRAQVTADYEVLVFIGDNLTDYSQIYAERGEDKGLPLVDETKDDLLANFVILPNPMYGEWEKAIYNNNYGLPIQDKLQKRKEALIGY